MRLISCRAVRKLDGTTPLALPECTPSVNTSTRHALGVLVALVQGGFLQFRVVAGPGKLAVAEDGGQKIVELVRQHGGDGADRCEALKPLYLEPQVLQVFTSLEMAFKAAINSASSSLFDLMRYRA